MSRSNLAARQRGAGKPRGRYRKNEDDLLLPAIRRFVDARPTYGYRRIAALVNRVRRSEGLAPINRKRVHRITQANALVWERHTGRPRGRIHDGKVMMMRSDLRWCSDGLEFTCWNGEIVRLAFIIDAFDREIIAFVAMTGCGISSSDVRDTMLEAVEKRFGTTRAPTPVEHLSDNGSPYIARETRAFALALNLVPCFKPVRSQESNGMSEAFVETFKRDYVRVNPLPDAPNALRQIAGWIEDYNEIHPHSALKMRSPREFIQVQSSQLTCPVKPEALQVSRRCGCSARASSGRWSIASLADRKRASPDGCFRCSSPEKGRERDHCDPINGLQRSPTEPSEPIGSTGWIEYVS